MEYFSSYDFTDFWNNSDWAAPRVGSPLTRQMVDMAESALGYKLPASYIELMQLHNGGVLQKNFFLPSDPVRSAVYLNAILGLDPARQYSLCGEWGSRRCINKWGYPDYGIYFGDTLSGGHEMFLMDYRSGGEPEILLVDQELDYRITFVAKNFETFIKGLLFEEDVPEDRL